MSSSIWTRCAGGSELRPLRLAPWRVVEAQHQLSTRKLVDTAEEQILLEELIDRAKPPAVGSRQLHYLLSTPFRYPPLRHGSRFGTRQERGVWYGSDTLHTAFAEVAYYRLVFFEGTSAELGTVTTALTAFRARAQSDAGVDLTAAPFDTYRRAIASPISYSASQALGTAMRESGVELFRYPSARAMDGVNIAAFVSTVFARSRPKDLATWYCTASRDRVEATRRDYFSRETLVYERAAFLVDGVLPSPAL